LAGLICDFCRFGSIQAVSGVKWPESSPSHFYPFLTDIIGMPKNYASAGDFREWSYLVKIEFDYGGPEAALQSAWFTGSA
jgi:hypothetical protein